MQSLDPEKFELVAPIENSRKRRWPKGIHHIEVAGIEEECITVIAVVVRNGKTERLPLAWSPVTNLLRRMFEGSWNSHGIDKKEGMENFRKSTKKLAKRMHVKKAQYNATLPLFN